MVKMTLFVPATVAVHIINSIDMMIIIMIITSMYYIFIT